MAQWLKLNSILHLKAEIYPFKPCAGLMIQCNCMFAGKQVLAALVWLCGFLSLKKNPNRCSLYVYHLDAAFVENFENHCIFRIKLKPQLSLKGLNQQFKPEEKNRYPNYLYINH